MEDSKILAEFRKLGDEIRQVGVLTEATNDKVELIAEQFGEIKETLNQHTKTLESHTEMIAKLSVDMTIVKEDIQMILKTKADKSDLTDVVHRIIVLEEKEANHERAY